MLKEITNNITVKTIWFQADPTLLPVLLGHFAYCLFFSRLVSVLSTFVKNLTYLLQGLETCLASGCFAAGAFQPDTICSSYSGRCGGDVFNNCFPSSMPFVCSTRQLLIELINMLFFQRQACCCCLYDILDKCLSFKTWNSGMAEGLQLFHTGQNLCSHDKNKDRHDAVLWWVTLRKKGLTICKRSLQLLLIYERLKSSYFKNSENPGKKKSYGSGIPK